MASEVKLKPCPEASRHKPGNAAAMREALEAIRNLAYEVQDMNREGDVKTSMPTAWVIDIVSAALSAPPRKGRWENGNRFEYEYAYCSECGRMQWAGWDSHREAEDNIESFANDYKFCPGCGTEMEGGVYVQ